MTGMEKEVVEKFKKGALEIYRKEVTDKEKCRKFSNKCSIKAQKRV